MIAIRTQNSLKLYFSSDKAQDTIIATLVKQTIFHSVDLQRSVRNDDQRRKMKMQAEAAFYKVLVARQVVRLRGGLPVVVKQPLKHEICISKAKAPSVRKI